MKEIVTKNAPAAIGPYAQGYIANGFAITSGQLGVDPGNGEAPEGIQTQAEWSCKNVMAILRHLMKYMQSILHLNQQEAVSL